MRNPLRSAIERSIHKMTGAGAISFDDPPGDPGLLGPDSVAWKVHADFVPMIAGGVSALMTQMLHPLAIAGVWDHSNFRADVMGRLARTAQFVAGTTYAARPTAEDLIARVKRRHEAVKGLDASGRAYSASDPALLTWVHVAEASGFLAAWLRFVDPTLPEDEQDRYFRETALIAEKLGAQDIPVTASAVAAWLRDMTPELRFDDRTREVLAAISAAPVRPAVLGVFRRFVMAAGFELMPAPMRALIPQQDRPRAPGALQAMAWATPVGRWAMRDSAAKKSRRRAAAPAGTP
ncbi:oxygenase MpaB family protein [Neomegalonema sp.]|uniref:oxygenase MpaB family protein n=1 Tax=Neomegalonema sp. TaxID=2039713 RepID=UPI002613FE21|nr:oxygenase MpaB family protein [Neomegalonema sp.]MDD2867784.1 oxygenase MpaB family protein [Neomegalonema sp.]